MKKVKKWKNKGQGLLMAAETFPLASILSRLTWKWNYWRNKTRAAPSSDLNLHSNTGLSSSNGHSDAVTGGRRRKHFHLLILLAVSLVACGLYYATYFQVVTTSWHWQWHGQQQQQVGGPFLNSNKEQETRPEILERQRQRQRKLKAGGHGGHVPSSSHLKLLSDGINSDVTRDHAMKMKGNESFINYLRHRVVDVRGVGGGRGQGANYPSNYSKHESESVSGRDGVEDERLEKLMACKVPRLNPMDDSVIEFIKTPPDVLCTSNSHPMIFRTNFHSTLIQMPQYRQHNLECCYKTFQRGNFSDKELKFSRDCYQVTRTEQMIPAEHEFIYIRCKNVTLTPINHTNLPSNVNSKDLKKSPEEDVLQLINFKDVFAFVPLKAQVETRIAQFHAFQREFKRRREAEDKVGQINTSKPAASPGIGNVSTPSNLTKYNNANSTSKSKDFQNNQVHLKTSKTKEAATEEGLSVLILGLDAQSHMNFLRQMPLTHNYLVQELNSISLNGYTKVSDNTFPNLIPLLTGLNVSELQELCWVNKNSYFDDCPFIWKEFGRRGYRTSFAEDSVWMGTFNYNKAGFLKQPTDYYLHPTCHFMAKKIGHEISGNSELCYGSRLSFEVLLEYIVKTAVTFGQSKRYFQFVWATALFHDFLNNPRIGDEILQMTIQFLHRSGFLNQTVFLLLSDHGIRWGGIRKTYQGKIEERMPLAYFTFPPWFHDRHPELIRNLRLNSKRLTTPFDIHQVLKDILHFPKTNYLRKAPVSPDFNFSGASTSSSSSSPHDSSEKINNANALHKRRAERGLSLFVPVPLSRSCEEAEISEHWCVCNAMEVVPSSSSVVRLAALFIVQEINSLLKGLEDYCAKLELSQINEAMKTIEDKFEALEETRPLTTTRPVTTTTTHHHHPHHNPVSKSDFITTSSTGTAGPVLGEPTFPHNNGPLNSNPSHYSPVSNSISTSATASPIPIPSSRPNSTRDSQNKSNGKGKYSTDANHSPKNHNNNNNNNNNNSKQYSESVREKIQLQITLVTQPGAGIFEATVTGSEVKRWRKPSLNNPPSSSPSSSFPAGPDHKQSNNETEAGYVWTWRWQLSGEISRTSQYGSQSACISHFILQKFCYCIDTAPETDTDSK